jgi:hypothetical protein
MAAVLRAGIPEQVHLFPAIASTPLRDMIRLRAPTALYLILRPSREVAGPEPPQALDPDGIEAEAIHPIPAQKTFIINQII